MSASRDEPASVQAPLRPTFQQIEIFLKVVETRSFVAAARLLGISQPAVSQAIAKMEELYDAALFMRRRNAPLSLTPVAEAVLPTARALLHTIDHQSSRAAAAALSQIGRLSIGFYPGICSGPLREGMSDFIRECPDIALRLVESSAGELHRQLNAGDLDIIFTAFLTDLRNPALVQEGLWSERLVVLLSDAHHFAQREQLTWDEVATQRIILGSSKGEMTGYRAISSRMGDRPLDCRHHAVTRGALFQLVTMGLGVTVTFPSAMLVTAGTVAVPIADDSAVVPIEAIWHQGDNNPIRHRLVRNIRDRAKAYSASATA
ncbi:transcriptional regulator, LysR family [Sphingopyxis sp. YR583]|uniref:LysR family transcriptional regulator n=1 Tax=Sphingopyxis sp. YR583 TaxID=1881047 RepID=UPI0008A7DAAA|nr:LysR family transcriptional regulator [Sphingopyxis sp. YR583]SEH14958.1 transcriptional regulator, LysR family [Sphingopyxis sp. YR583]